MKIPIWDDMEASTRKLIIVVIGAIVITAMITGNFDTLIGLFK